MNSLGMTTGPAVGRYLAEWIVEGSPSVDLWSLDVRRFDHIHNNVKYLEDRATESLGQWGCGWVEVCGWVCGRVSKQVSK